MKVHIATSRDIGEVCKRWAQQNTPEGFSLTESMKECDIFISVMYDKLISEDFIQSKKACYNIHPGVLPQYRGSGAFSWAIINEEESTGVTLHKIDVSIDHGEIICIDKFPITKEDTAETLFKKAEERILFVFKNWFYPMLKNNLKGEQQDESKAKTYYKKDVERIKDLTRFIKAFTFKGKENAYYYDNKKRRHYLVY